MPRLFDTKICVGVTGLSRSGKSTFITSLINQLEQYDKANLPGFSPVLTERLMGTKHHPLKDQSLAVFPYEQSYAAIASASPTWPEPTTGLSGCEIELKIRQRSKWYKPLASDTAKVRVEIRDYPGEWLLDLPLLRMDYQRWCAQCSTQFTSGPRVKLLGPLLEDLQSIDPLEDADLGELKQLTARYKRFLHECKQATNSLSLIQPGRFLIPGVSGDNQLLEFIPLLRCGNYTERQLKNASKRSWYKVCQHRYQRYVKELVKPFHADYCASVERQLVLVDVVNALNGGPDYVDDMRQALANITECFSYGTGSIFSRKIDKVVFAATKSDQVLSEDHDAVRQLLSLIVRQAYKAAQYEGVEPVCEAIASVRASREVSEQGETGVAGIGSNGEPIGYIHPRIPDRLPEGEEWQPYTDWKIPALQPPKGLSARNGDVIPHIRLDTVLNALIGDKCK